ncbi:MAG: helix-turn-helix domain-containing protein [Armatimonadetes bacterium]|nr:helix-turn-helix domain-containing protein [Armatimonadota bacterium]
MARPASLGDAPQESQRRGIDALLHKPASLEELVETLADLLGNPVTIEDAAFRLLAYSRQTGRVDATRRKTILNKSGPAEYVRWLQQNGMIQRISQSPEPVRIPPFPGVDQGPRLAIAIRARDRVLGHIWVQETERRVDRTEARFLLQAAVAAAVLMLRQEADKESRGRPVREFLADLLDGQFVEEAAVQRRAEGLGIELPEAYGVVIADIDGFERHVVDHDEAWVQGLKVDLLSAIRRLAAANDERPLLLTRSDSVVILIGDASPPASGPAAIRTRTRRLAEVLQQRLHEEFPALSFTIGTSDIFTGVGRLPQAYRQAVEAVRVGKDVLGGRRVVCYAELGILRLLHVIQTRDEAEGYHNLHLGALEAYDRRHRTGLVRTLETYLDAFGRLGPAASTLGVHPNTVTYRIKRIQEISGLDLEDPAQRMTAHLELKVRRLRKAR